MFIDASAIVAILTDEPEAAALQQTLEKAETAATSPLSIYEAVLAIHRKRPGLADAQADVEAFLLATNTAIAPITAHHAELATQAHARFGKGTGHPAQLNMGDCFSYPAAKALNKKLLYKGRDFTHTDLP